MANLELVKPIPLNLDERRGEIEWFKDLRETMLAGDIESCITVIDRAIDLLERAPRPKKYVRENPE